ncbi:uncharacterized protein TNCV_2014041 [Trichonephila clavipes]|nr:uncharacterized protein TNCV_2014041 [Trichonephila clavipes]
MLSETWIDNDERVSIPNFDCCPQFKRPGRRAAGVAIYRKQKNLHVVTPHTNNTYRQTSGLGIVSNDIGGHIVISSPCENISRSISVSLRRRINERTRIKHYLNMTLLRYST